MTPQQRTDRARRAKQAMDEFFGPAFAVVEQEYGERMISVAASTDPRAPEIIARLGNGIQVARQVRAQIEAIIADGQVAEREIERGERLDAMSAPKRRLASIGQV